MNGRSTLAPGDIVAGPSRTRTSRPPPKLAQPAALASISKAAPPARTLKQPMTLRVAESSTGAGSISGGGAQDKDDYLRALKRKAELSRRVDKWMDKLMEETVDRSQLQRALSYMHAGQYGEVEHERHLNGLCSYPLCENPPSAPYRAHKRFQISARAKTIKEVEGNADEGFCSKRCRVKSQWVRENLGSEAAWLRGKVAPLELLDDMEDSGELVWEGGKNGQYKRLRPSASGADVVAGGGDAGSSILADDNKSNDTNQAVPPGASGLASTEPSTEISTQGHAPRGAGSVALPRDKDDKVAGVSAVSRPLPTLQPSDSSRNALAATPVAGATSSSAARAPPLCAGTGPGSGPPVAGTGATAGLVPPVPAPAGDSGDVDDLLGSLVIRERDTTAEVPVPPTLNPPPAQLVPKPPPPAAARKARNTSSMIDGANSKLAQSVLTAHRQMKPVLQHDGSDDEEEGYQEQEWERQMGWGGGDELEAMFEEARRARELAEQ